VARPVRIGSGGGVRLPPALASAASMNRVSNCIRASVSVAQDGMSSRQPRDVRSPDRPGEARVRLAFDGRNHAVDRTRAKRGAPHDSNENARRLHRILKLHVLRKQEEHRLRAVGQLLEESLPFSSRTTAGVAGRATGAGHQLVPACRRYDRDPSGRVVHPFACRLRLYGAGGACDEDSRSEGMPAMS
jgi:hypothetical protein